jgi:broad specificity phosphatase PhoE
MPMPDKIMLIRHGEKPLTPPPAGVAEDGSQDEHSLLVRGWQRAGALVGFFSAPIRTGIARPNAVFASGTTEDPSIAADIAKSLRPQETVVPLCRKMDLAAITAIAVGDEEHLIESIRSTAGTVLVSWEHKHIPSIAAGFVTNPPDWGDRFDAVWILDRQPDGSYKLSILNQDLLDGDTPA